MLSNQILVGDCRETLKTLPDNSVHCVVTSPPYFGQRDYEHALQLGLEQTPEQFVDSMVEVFREVRRVLRDDGNFYLNLGDTYSVKSTYNAAQSLHTDNNWKQAGESRNTACYERTCGVPAKNLLMIPARVALALQADGWILREDIVWRKPNSMPESVKDRCSRSHEYLFHFTKQSRYFYDAEAVKEEAVTKNRKKWTDGGSEKQRGHSRRHAGFNGRYAEKIAAEGAPTKRNRRSVWDIATKPFKEAHFATYPPELVEPCVLAGCPVGGIVLDPFLGSGTTAIVAKRLGRSYIGCELNPKYVAMAERRINPPIVTEHNPILFFAVAA